MFALPLRFGALAVASLVATGCAARNTSLRVLEPATVNLPADIQVIGVIDRSGAQNAGDTVLGALEGFLTGEHLSADRQGREAAIDALILTLQESPRFDAVRAEVDRRSADGLFDRELDHRVVKRICRQIGCDALLSLEAFDSDSAISLQGVQVTSLTNLQDLKETLGNLDGDSLEASSQTTVMASWRLYDADQDVVLDELRDRQRTNRWQGTGSLTDLQRAMPAIDQAVPKTGAEAGADYAARIAPTWQWVGRRFYTTGDPAMREAKRYVEAGDWEGAIRLWRRVADDPSRRVRGKALFNVALAHEALGDLDKALESARDAAVALHNESARDYVFTLEQRQRDEVRLAAQMEPAPEVADAEEPPASARTRPDRRRPTSQGTDNRTGGGMTRPR